MKKVSAWIGILCFVAVAAFAAAPAPKLILPAVPELGTTIRTVPDLLSWQLVRGTSTEGATVLPCFDVTVGQIDYTVAVEGKKHRVVWVSSQATMFVTPENCSVRTKVGDLMAKYPNTLVVEEGFGSYVPLPSGWNALVLREGKLDPAARALLYFKREAAPQKKE